MSEATCYYCCVAGNSVLTYDQHGAREGLQARGQTDKTLRNPHWAFCIGTRVSRAQAQQPLQTTKSSTLESRLPQVKTFGGGG